MAMKEKGKSFLVGAAVGGMLGAVTALLLAPKPGKELRADIAEGCQAVGEKTQELAKKVSGQTAEWIGRAKDAGAHVLDEVKTWRFGREAGEESEEPTAAISQLPEKEMTGIVEPGEHI